MAMKPETIAKLRAEAARALASDRLTAETVRKLALLMRALNKARIADARAK